MSVPNPMANHDSLADRIHGTEPQPLDVVLPHLIHDIYNYDGNHAVEGAMGWRPMTPDELQARGVDPSMQVNTRNGLLSQVYTNDQGGFALVYAGSNEWKDWVPTNFGQGLGFETAQYSQAIRLAQQCQRAFGDDLVLSGQSLGGGLAAAASMVTGAPAVTYNAAGVHKRTVERFGVDFDEARAIAEEGNIRSYRVEGDILTRVQEKTPILRSLMPDAVGVQIDLPNPYPDKSPDSIRQGIQLHLIHAVIDSMESAYPEWHRNIPEHSQTGQQAPPEAASGPLLADQAHPANGMYRQSLQGLQQAGQNALAASSHEQEQLAGAVTVQAQRDGFARVDRVVFGDEGRRTFAFEGEMDSPLRRRLTLDTAEAARTPLAQSSADSLQLAERNGPAPGQVHAAAQQHNPDPHQR